MVDEFEVVETTYSYPAYNTLKLFAYKIYVFRMHIDVFPTSKGRPIR